MKPMMGCGHAANATDGDGKPSCAICALIHPGASQVVAAPDLTGRVVRCSYFGTKCQSQEPSSTDLAFFSHNPTKPFDSMYCGCFGWD